MKYELLIWWNGHPARHSGWWDGRLARLCLLVCLIASQASAQSDFATTIYDYTPAPGQFVNAALFSNPVRALGPPTGGGTIAPDNSSLVTLGGFGGSITLGFDHRVLDDPHNPLGLDFIIFGNASWSGGNPLARFAEAATVEISLDLNANGLPDDAWFLIPGSHLNIPPSTFTSQLWDNNPGTSTPPANIDWYPAGARSPMTTAAFRLPSIFESQLLINADLSGAESFVGYAELSPTLLLGDFSGADGSAGDNQLGDPEDDPAVDPAVFYTVPDDPFRVGIDPGSGGGDAFDIAWAIDPATGNPANLIGFDFIRISTAVNFIAGPLGELSAEIDAVADARPAPSGPDLTGDGLVNGADLAALLSMWGVGASPADLTGDGVVNGADLAALLSAWTSAP